MTTTQIDQRFFWNRYLAQDFITNQVCYVLFSSHQNSRN